MRDFFWPEPAKVVRGRRLIDRTWETFGRSSAREAGYYQNVDKLKDAARTSRPQPTSPSASRGVRNIDRTQDLVEVLEYWTPERVITVGNRAVVLRDGPNPFWNGRMPFIVCSGDAGRLPDPRPLGGRGARPAAGDAVDAAEPAARRGQDAREPDHPDPLGRGRPRCLRVGAERAVVRRGSRPGVDAADRPDGREHHASRPRRC